MFSITKNGNDAKNLCVIDKVNKTVSTKEYGLVFDFKDESGWSFTTGYSCTFNTGSYCTFTTDSDCTFKTGYSCTFKTGSYCTFKTGEDCTFTTFSNCTFTTSSDCTFKTGSDCKFKTGENCVCVRRDIYEVIEIPPNEIIKLREYGVKGWKDSAEVLVDAL